MKEPILVRPAGHWRETPIARVLGPIDEFMHGSASGGLILLAMTALALFLANSPLASLYHEVLHTELAISLGPLALRLDLLHWINDGLMAIFFFLIGLELKREVLVGELADRRAALLPVLAAIGGAAVPALLYSLINLTGPGAAGWGVPMATDIAFALGVIALLGDRVPFSLRVFLTGVAIVDDLLAVLVIALFYSDGLELGALGLGLGLLIMLALVNLIGIRSLLVYAVLGVLVWVAFLQSGVHATLAGALVALTVPARRRIDAPTFFARTSALLARFRPEAERPTATLLTDQQQQDVVLELEDTCEQVLAPLQKAEHKLHRWVAFGVLPIFALANAGVAVTATGLAGPALPVTLGIIVGLLLGKPLGLLGATYLAVRLGLSPLPAGASWRQLLGIGCLAGIGFTMALFIATLGFGDSPLLTGAKLGILAASAVAGLAGYLLLRQTKPRPLDTAAQHHD